MNKEEKCTKENLIFRGRIISLFDDDVITPEGNLTKREYIAHPGGACCLPFQDGYIYFEKQFRYPYHKEILELPAGKLEKGEDPSQAMKRELTEEIGFKSNHLVPMGYMYPSCGCSNEIIYLFFSDDNTFTKTHPDQDELIEIVKLTPQEAYLMLDNNEIPDAKTALLLEKLRSRLLK